MDNWWSTTRIEQTGRILCTLNALCIFKKFQLSRRGCPINYTVVTNLGLNSLFSFMTRQQTIQNIATCRHYWKGLSKALHETNFVIVCIDHKLRFYSTAGQVMTWYHNGQSRWTRVLTLSEGLDQWVRALHSQKILAIQQGISPLLPPLWFMVNP